MVRDQTLPDSPPWVFTNPSNVLTSVEGKVIYSGANKVNVVDVRSGKCVQVLGSDNPKAKVVFVAGWGSALAYTLSDGSVYLLGLYGTDVFSQGKLTIRNDTIESIAYLSEEHLLIGGKSGKVYLCTKNSIDRVISCSPEPVSKLKTLLGMCVFGSRSLYLLDSFGANGSPLYAHKRPIAAVSLVTNTLGDLCTALIDVSGTLLTLQGTNLRHTVKLPDTGASTPRLYALCWLHEDALVCGLPDGQLHLYHTRDSLTSQLFINNLHTKAILGLTVTEAQVVSFSIDRRMTLWTVTDSTDSARCYTQPVWSFSTLGASVQGLVVTASDKVLISTGELHLIAWTPHFQSQISVPIDSLPTENALKSLTLCPFSDNFLSILTEKDTIFVYDLTKETVVNKLAVAEVQSTSWKSSTELFILSNRSLYTWNLTSSQLISLYSLPEDCSVFINIEENMWFGSIRGNILTYSSPTCRFYANTTHASRITDLKCNKTKEIVAGASEDSAISLHLKTGRLVGVLGKHWRPVLCLAWHPTDASILASGSLDHSIQLWNTTTSTAILSLRGHLGAVRHLVWGNSDCMYSGSDDQTVKVWDLTIPRPDIEPPVLQMARKNEVSRVKSLFPKLHPLVYQQSRSDALSTCLSLLTDPSKPTSEHFLFNLNREKALYLVKESKRTHDSVVLTFWEQLKVGGVERESEGEVAGMDVSWTDLAPLLGVQTWRKLCLKKAEDALLERNSHKAGLYYIAGGDLQGAIDLYTSSGLYIDAVLLCALLEQDLPRLYRQWAEKLTTTGLFEQAFKCYIGSKDYLQAYETIGKSTTKDTLKLTEIQEKAARLI